MWRKKKKSSDGLLGVVLGSHSFGLVSLSETGRVDFCTGGEFESDQLAPQLRRAVEQNRLSRDVNLVLLPSQYQMLLAEAPEVPEAELADAMRWRIKDLISTPLDEVEVDAFLLPDDAYRGRVRMCYTAAVRRDLLAHLTSTIEGAGLQLRYIDLADLALRNLAMQQAMGEKSVAIINLRDRGGMVTVTQNNQLYMSRSLQVGFEHIETQGYSVLDDLVLDLQRSFDYYESQQNKGPVAEVLISGKSDISDELVEQLDQRVAAWVKRFDAAAGLQLAEGVDLAQLSRVGLSLGGALRTRGQDVAAAG
ncbi:pilus assembly protein PilM [Aestuariirhabdus sp. Z084]|uniref:type IV pilus biogenesis protein PilM n=1 Tax=Aestuariirhabdus haliotis TaxID=2918751 RepID=UPI00201B4527|nr:pilus assembly protein PilM [Aestuariirhabdus haliotis]MCL6415000.1 pilus assembly protein PilM [Aestuariirhabdus haliotis]MCL6418932.1 pilus assembly protein PilM [Aestuariirhabdus haliotis]